MILRFFIHYISRKLQFQIKRKTPNRFLVIEFTDAYINQLIISVSILLAHSHLPPDDNKDNNTLDVILHRKKYIKYEKHKNHTISL